MDRVELTLKKTATARKIIGDGGVTVSSTGDQVIYVAPEKAYLLDNAGYSRNEVVVRCGELVAFNLK